MTTLIIEDVDLIPNEAIVLIAVGIRKKWKASVSFYFTKGLTSETKKKLIFDAIEQLHHVGLNAQVIIFDGCVTNLAT